MMDVRLREVRDEDLPSFFEHQRDPRSVELVGLPPRDADAFAAHWERIRADPTTILRTVVVDGEVAGGVLSWPDEGRRLIGYGYGHAYWGRGIATRACRAFLEELAERPLYAYVTPSNVGSRRVLEKCGFVEVSRDDEEILYELTEPGSLARTRSSTSSVSAT